MAEKSDSPRPHAAILPAARKRSTAEGDAAAGAAFDDDALRAVAARRAEADAERSGPAAFPESPAHEGILVLSDDTPPQDEVVVRVREDGAAPDEARREITVPTRRSPPR